MLWPRLSVLPYAFLFLLKILLQTLITPTSAQLAETGPALIDATCVPAQVGSGRSVQLCRGAGVPALPEPRESVSRQALVRTCGTDTYKPTGYCLMHG